ncbi:glyoxylase-like metal-dependent hydrolase (beta-lactamase superfamily II) [Kineococcus rhizosphaerae]|uniref:Glyoxylase-like metal-dependent hydrolase (Beta-lactamase superfamily II) n=1 Tax=Kineococcus rhizosphaerae TaxID=559628 RepID=A0A2T0QXZ4_9ACTN|nr:MBL fold metallo-hydrolase [Kineococcus rhizosphaerae]PRY11092.1 glyoxylase-like metal-dependent hydrolase (beta-lactamase superfamily II) [Kineococcus rhizosphaerae]
MTSGTFSLDGQTFDVDNNVWIVGDDEQVVVIDAPHDVEAIAAAVGDRRLLAVVCTHAHDDHVRQAPALAARFSTDAHPVPVLLHPADREVWELTHEGVPTTDLANGEVVTVAGTDLHVLHTPGHTPGAVSLYAPELATVFTGDTLFAGGPGATGRSFSSFATIVDSIRDVLFELPPETRVHTGHGDDTTIGDESPHLQEWVDRGH